MINNPLNHGTSDNSLPLQSQWVYLVTFALGTTIFLVYFLEWKSTGGKEMEE